MASMGYCKFENTLPYLQQIADELFEEQESETEERARKRVLKLIHELAQDIQPEDLASTPQPSGGG